LRLSSKPMNQIAAECSKWCKYVALKVPRNADLLHIDVDPRLKHHSRIVFKHFVLLILQANIDASRPVAFKGRNEFKDERMEGLLMSLMKLPQFERLLKGSVVPSTYMDAAFGQSRT